MTRTYADGIEDAAAKAWAETWIRWEASEEDQHATRLRVCAERRRDWPGSDDDCDHDGRCDECTSDMAEEHETIDSRIRRQTAKRIHSAIRTLSPSPGGIEDAREALTGGASIDELWQDLIEKDDRTSPEEYPEMALISYDEFANYMCESASSKIGGDHG